MEHPVVLKVMKTTQSWNMIEVQPQQMPFTQWTAVLRFQPTILFLHRYSWQTLKSIFLREQMNVHFLSWRNWVRRDAIAVVWARINHKMANNNCLFVFIQMPPEKAGLEKVTTSEKYSIPELQQNTTGSSLCQQATSRYHWCTIVKVTCAYSHFYLASESIQILVLCWYLGPKFWECGQDAGILCSCGDLNAVISSTYGKPRPSNYNSQMKKMDIFYYYLTKPKLNIAFT